jgi:signal recognition particle GTPase
MVLVVTLVAGKAFAQNASEAPPYQLSPETLKIQAALEAKKQESRRKYAEARAQAKAEADAKEAARMTAIQEGQRAAKEQQEADEAVAKEDRRLAAIPKLAGVAWSSRYCAAAAKRSEALAEIKQEKAYANKAGVVNLGLLEELKNILKRADADMADARDWLNELKEKQTPCSDPDVATYVACQDWRIEPLRGPFSADASSCSSEQNQRFLRMVITATTEQK